MFATEPNIIMKGMFIVTGKGTRCFTALCNCSHLQNEIKIQKALKLRILMMNLSFGKSSET